MGSLEVGINRGSQLQLYQAMWGPVYEAVLNILGSTGVILPIGDPKHGQPSASTFRTVGEEQLPFTWSESPAWFDTPLALTDPGSFQGIMPTIAFNGGDEEADTPDAAYWTRGDGASDRPFSVGAWIRPQTLSGRDTILAKYNSNIGSREWYFTLDEGRTSLYLYDDSARVSARRLSDAAVTASVWSFAAATYDGAGGASAADTIVIYENGSAAASTAANSASYVATESLSSPAQLAGLIGVYGGAVSFFDGRMAGGPLGPFFTHKQVSADEVLRLYEIGRRALGL